MASHNWLILGSDIAEFHLQEYSTGGQSWLMRDCHLGRPSALGAGPSRGTCDRLVEQVMKGPNRRRH